VSEGAVNVAGPVSPGPRRSWIPVALVVTVVLLLLGPWPGVLGSGASSAASAFELAATPQNQPADFSNLTLNTTAIDLSPYFWGTTVEGRSKILPTEGNLITSTPTQTIVWPGGSTGDDYDPINNTLHNPLNGSVTAAPTSEAQFVSFCHTLNCSAIVEVPGEIDNPQYAAQIVNYTENTLHFHPAFWEIGNEPELWRHWGVPWSQWPASGPVVGPFEFAHEVQAYINAMRAIDPAIHVLGVTSTGRANGPWPVTDWTNATVEVNGPNLSGVAVHIYPAGPKTVPQHSNLNMFYGALNGPGGLPSRVESIRAGVRASLAQNWSSDPGLSVPVFVTEIGTALAHHQFGQYAINFGGALGLAAMMTQAMALNVTNLDLFGAVMNTNNSWFDLNGTERPDYEAYSQLFTHLGPVAYPVTLPGFNSTLFGIATIDPNDGNRSDLLVVNANTTTAVNYTPKMAGPAPDSTVHFWYWNGTVQPGTTHRNTTWVTASTPTPLSMDLPGLPAVQEIPAQGIELFEWYPSGASSVKLATSGLPSGARWFAHVGARLVTSNQSSLVLFLPNGTYPTSTVPIPLPLHAKTASSVERLAGFPPSPIVVSGSPQTVPIPFAAQWHVTLSVDPSLLAGHIVPSLSWANASQPLDLYAVPASGYHFTRWFGWGPGSTNGTNTMGVIDPTGPITERAHFAALFAVDFTETGLPTGTSWTVELRGTNESSTNATISFGVPDIGLYGFQVTPVPGYRVHPPAGSVNVTGSPTVETIAFQKLTPPPPPYPVSFEETGLANGTNWSVVVRSVTYGSNGSTISFSERNGTYGFNVSFVPGYRPVPRLGSFTVNGSAFVQYVTFIAKTPRPPLYPVTFEESGLPGGTTWSVTVRGVTNHSSSTEIGFDSSNGTYGFQVGAVPGYRSQPTNSSYTVHGSAVLVSITFLRRTPPPPKFAVTFVESGLPAGTSWSVTVRGSTNSSTTDTIGFDSSNGTYGFHVGAVPGYRSQPVNSSYTVNGTAIEVPIQFIARTPPPPLYPVAFQETGLPNGTNWSVTVRNVTYVSNGSTISFGESNGTYGFNVSFVLGYRPSPRLGSFNVSGLPVTVSITFIVRTPPPATYAVTFQETGLPSGTSWSVTVRGVTNTSSTAAIGFRSSNGTYGFEVGSVPGYRSEPTNSSYTVNGSAVSVAVTFLRKTPPPPMFPVVFTESGLPADSTWSVVVRNVTHASNSTTIDFSESNGTYGFNVSFVPGYRPVPRFGSFNVTGAPVGVSVTYLTLTPPPPTYPVTFEESGLPGGTTWSVTVRNETISSAFGALQFDEPNGRYGYSVGVVSNYTRHPPSSGFTVSGGPVAVTVVFDPVRIVYRNVWTESGFWGTGKWWVEVNNVSYNCTGAWATALLPNGTYRYAVEDSNDFVPTPRFGTFEVHGAPHVISVNFTEARFAVTFMAHGLPAGTKWTVRLADNNSSTASASLAIPRPNGTYTFDVLAPEGYYAVPSHGNITVHAQIPAVVITFVVNGPGPTPPIWFLVARATAVGAVVVLGAWGGFALMRAVRRGRGGPALF